MTEPLDLLMEEASRCIGCGFCESVCPTLPAAGYNLSKGARGRVMLGRELAENVKAGNKSIAYDSFYSCLDCFACLQVCPAGVNAGLVSHYAKEVIAKKKDNENPYVKMIISTTMKYMNPFGLRERSAEWANGLKFSKMSENLLYTGNMYQLMANSRNLSNLRKILGKTMAKFMVEFVASFPFLIKVPAGISDREFNLKLYDSLRNIVKLLQMAGVDFAYMGPDEPYPGIMIYDLGYFDEFRTYANKVYLMIKGTGAKRVITVDPHTYDLLKNVYPKFVRDFDLDVIFYTELLSDLNLSKITGSFAYHEPCHLVLHNDYYGPLYLLRKIADVRLASRNGKRNKCCGGPVELTFPELSEAISQERYKELMETGAESIVTACPICFTNLSKGDNTVDLSEVLIRAAHKNSLA